LQESGGSADCAVGGGGGDVQQKGIWVCKTDIVIFDDTVGGFGLPETVKVIAFLLLVAQSSEE
jgi:hypothetical protein